MTKTGKIVLWVTIAVVLIGGGVGAYFVLKPKEGQTKIGKDGKTYTFTNGVWIEAATSSKDNTPVTTPTNTYNPTGGGVNSGKKSCYDVTVEKLQKKLIGEGVSIDADGCMSNDTKTAMNKYGYSISGDKILKTTKITPTLKLGLWTATDSVTTYGTRKLPTGYYDIILTSKGKIGKRDAFIGTVVEFKALTYGTFGSMNLIRVIDNKGNNIWVENQNNVLSKKTVEV